MEYTINGFTVKSFYEDTITEQGIIGSIPSVDFQNDFVLTSRGVNEATFVNKTGNESGAPAESCKVQIGTVPDMYAGSDIPRTQRSTHKTGRKYYISEKPCYTVTDANGNVEYVTDEWILIGKIQNAPSTNLRARTNEGLRRLFSKVVNDPNFNIFKTMEEGFKGALLPEGLR